MSVPRDVSVRLSDAGDPWEEGKRVDGIGCGEREGEDSLGVCACVIEREGHDVLTAVLRADGGRA